MPGKNSQRGQPWNLYDVFDSSVGALVKGVQGIATNVLGLNPSVGTPYGNNQNIPRSAVAGSSTPAPTITTPPGTEGWGTDEEAMESARTATGEPVFNPNNNTWEYRGPPNATVTGPSNTQVVTAADGSQKVMNQDLMNAEIARQQALMQQAQADLEATRQKAFQDALARSMQIAQNVDSAHQLGPMGRSIAYKQALDEFLSPADQKFWMGNLGEGTSIEQALPFVVRANREYDLDYLMNKDKYLANFKDKYSRKRQEDMLNSLPSYQRAAVVSGRKNKPKDPEFYNEDITLYDNGKRVK